MVSDLPADAVGGRGHYLHWLTDAVSMGGLSVPSESPAELAGLRAALDADLGPKGALENLLVDIMCTAVWRWRRLLRLETAVLAEGSGEEPAEPPGHADRSAAQRAAGQVDRLRERGKLSRAQEREARRLFGNLPPDQLYRRYVGQRVGMADQLQAAISDRERHHAWLHLTPLATGMIPSLGPQESLLMEQWFTSLDRLLALRAQNHRHLLGQPDD